MRTTQRNAAFPLSLILAVSAPALAQQRHMQLLAPDVGWVLGGGRLYWTTDNGADWTDITPPLPEASEKIAPVFFSDPSQGWVLLSRLDTKTDEWRFDLAQTVDGGSMWAATPLIVPPLGPAFAPIGGPISMDFVDSLHGWIDMAVKRSGRIGLWMASAVVLVVAAFPYYSEAVANFLLPSNQATALLFPGCNGFGHRRSFLIVYILSEYIAPPSPSTTRLHS